MEAREIVIPHDLTRGSVVGVRRMLVHSSIAGLKEKGLYERYGQLMDRKSLELINELIGPGWMPIDLAMMHYSACDALELSDQEINSSGLRAGEEMGKALQVAIAHLSEGGAAVSVWSMIGAFSRMGRRLHEGGSSQYVKLAPNRLLIEHKGNPLFATRYFRLAHGGFMRQTFASVGHALSNFKFSTYNPVGAQIEARLSWK